MKIGLTYDLRETYLALGMSEEETAEFDRGETIEAIAGVLQELGHEVDHVGSIRDLIPRLVSGQRWDLVFNLAEGVHGLGREAQIPALLDAYGIPYTFSDPCALALALHKGFAKHVMRDLGLPTADFAVVDREADLARLHLTYPLFAKPVGEGTGKGIGSFSRVDEPAALAALCRRLLAEYRQPVLVEEYLPGREFTVGILGTAERAVSLGALEVVIREEGEQGAYSYANKERCEELVEYRLVSDREALQAEATALRAYRALGCRDAGRIDVRSDRTGVPHIIELNPLAGLHPEHSDLPILARMAGMDYRRLIEGILLSALERSQAPAPAGSPNPRLVPSPA